MQCLAVTILCLTLAVPATTRVPDWLVHDITDRSHVVQGDNTLLMTNGLIAREFTLAPDLFTSDFYSYEKESSLLRAVTAEAQIGLDGAVFDIGGVLTDTPRAYLNRTYLMSNLKPNPSAFHFKSYKISKPVAPFPYAPRRHAPEDIIWPPKGVRIDFTYTAPTSAKPEHRNVTVVVTYEMYDGVPFISKWLTIVPPSSPVKPAIEATVYSVEYLAVNFQWGPGYNWLITDTDIPHGSQVSWIQDPLNNQPGSKQPNVNCSYVDHFNVPLTTPLVSFRVRHLVVGSADQERQGFAKRRILRLLAPWTQENPIFFHMTHNDTMTPYKVIDQMAEVGFEMLIYSFGYGFDIESTNSTYIKGIAAIVKYANDRGIEVGGYDLIAASRTPPTEFAAIDPKTGKPSGNSCIASGWYDYLLDRFTSFMDKTGLSMVETDGPYGGYQCASKKHSHHRDVTDSVYWGDIYQTKFFQALQERGAYINQPDTYFYAGGSKTGMGYNEDQYSLPRWQDISVSRQGMFDDLLHYTPSVGWMFLPLVDYHGGGAAAEIEPLVDHLKEYEWGLAQYLGAGVAACYRGYRLYDSDVTKALVKKWVDFYKQHRDILNSDVVHVRRADMQSIDSYMHVNPKLSTKGLAMVFNPTERKMAVNLTLPLYYTGIDDVAKVAEQGASPKAYRLARDYSVDVPVSLDPLGITWLTIAL